MKPAAFILALACAASGRGEIIDRIAVSVGNRVITRSDLEREIRVTAFLNAATPDLSAANRRATAARMVDQRLVRRELELSRYPAPAPAEAQEWFAKLKAARYPDEAQGEAALARYGVTAQDVRDALYWQLTFLRFVDVHFRPSVQVSAREIRDYFEREVRPAAEAARPGERPALAQYRDQIEKTLIGRQVDRALEAWLQEARRRTAVEYREEVFR